MKQDQYSAAQLTMLVGVTAVVFFLGLVPLEIIPEIPVDIDSKPFFIPLALVALLPTGKPAFAVAFGVAMGEGLRDLMEGYELDDPFGFVAYVLSFVIASYVIGMRPLNRGVLALGAFVCAAIQSTIEALTFLLFGEEGVGVAIWSAIGNTVSHGIVWGAIPLMLVVPALHGRFERYLGFTPKALKSVGTLANPHMDEGASEDALIWARKLAYREPGAEDAVLKEVDLTVLRGERVGVIGPAKAGIAQLARVISGLAPRSLGGERAGAIRVAGSDPAAQEQASAGQISLITANPIAQLMESRAEDEVLAALRHRGQEDGKRLRERARELLDAVGLPRDRQLERTWELEEDEQQLVVVAAALAPEPEVVLLDDAMRALDRAGRETLMRMLDERKEDIVVLMFDNDLERQLGWADRIVVLHEGRTIAEGAPRELLSDGALLAKLGFPPPLEFAEPGHATERRSHGKKLPTTEPLLLLSELRCTIDENVTPIDHLSLEVRAGEVVGIAGSGGAGKTTLARLIAGLAHPDRGHVWMDGEDVTKLKAHERIGKVAVALRDTDTFLSEKTVTKEIAFPLRRTGLSPEERNRRAKEIAGRLSIDGDLLSRDPLLLTKGQAKRVQLAALMGPGARLLVLDEPSAYLDPSEREDLAAIIRQLAGDGAGVLLLDNDSEFLAECADRIGVLRDGRLTEPASPNAAFAPDRWSELREAGLGVPAAARLSQGRPFHAATRRKYLAALSESAA